MRKFIYILSILFIASCSSDNGSDSGSDTSNYDKEAMLTSWADNIIVPAFEDYQQKVNTLNNDVTTFNGEVNLTNLNNLRSSWLEAYKAYQHVGIFDIGKATELKLTDKTNTYPTDTENILANINGTDYNLETQAQYASQGFPALDYLLYGITENDEDILDLYLNESGYSNYLTAITTQLKTTADAIVIDWNNTYRETFINNSNVVTGSVNQMANNYIENFEKDVRAPKLGIPAGVFSNGVFYPEKVEAYYKNDISKTLLIEATKASQDFFNGVTFGTTTSGPGLKEFLDAVDATSDGEKLSTIINNQYATIFTEIDKLDDSFSDQISSNNSAMLTTYEALQQNVVYIKLDMISALSLTIDYVDGDGD